MLVCVDHFREEDMERAYKVPNPDCTFQEYLEVTLNNALELFYPSYLVVLLTILHQFFCIIYPLKLRSQSNLLW